jgi:hypothetical protein
MAAGFGVFLMHFNWRKLRDPKQEKANNVAWRAELTVLVQEDDELREDGRRLCETNLLALCYILGYCLITPEDHHDALAFFPEKDPNKNVQELAVGVKRRRSLLLPRNTYKTTIDFANCVQFIIVYHMTIAILILTGAKDLAFDFVDQVSSFFYHPKNRPPTLFQALYPELCTDEKPDRGEFTCPLRQREPKIVEPLIWGNSIGSSTTGWHPDVLVCDDMANNINSKTFEARVRLTKAYKLTRKILKPTGIEIKIGTPYGTGDLFVDEVLTARPGSYERLAKPAMRLLSGDRLDANGFPDESEVELFYPSILSYEYLRDEYEGSYESFMSQYMIDTYGAAEVVFTEAAMLAAMVEEEKIPMEGKTFIHWRLPSKELGWKLAACAVGIMYNNRVYIEEIQQGHYKPSVLAKLIHDVARSRGVHEISIEDAPGAQAMHPHILNHALTTGWEIRVTWEPFEHDGGVRDTSIRGIEALIAGGRLLFSDGLKVKQLMEGFLQYGMTDDHSIPDVVMHVARNLPASIRNNETADEELAWEMMRQRDKYNFIYGRGAYAPPEPDPEPEEEVYVEAERTHTHAGLEIIMPGLE